MKARDTPALNRGGPAAWLVPAVLIALPFLWFWRGTAGQVLLTEGDALSIFFPMRRMFAEQVAAGVLPLWNPRVFAGMPFFAAMQTGMLYPPTWLFLVLPPVVAMNLLVLVHFAGAALATYAYARAIGCRPAAAGFAGLAFAGGGFAIAHMGNLPLFQGLPWIPLLLIALERLRHRVRYRDVLLGVSAVAISLFIGHPQLPAYGLFVGALYVGFLTLFDAPAAGRLRYLGSALAVALGGVALAAVQLVPGAELGAQSVRAGLSFADFVAFALPARQLPMLLFPFLFGGDPGISYWGRWLFMEMTGYPGIVPLMLAGAALAAVRREPLVRFWLALGVWSLLLALGRGLPLARLMFHVPVYNLFRAQVRNLAVFDLAVALLAAVALDRLTAPRWRRALATSALIVLATVLAVVVAATVAGPTLWGELALHHDGGPRDDALRASLSIHGRALLVPTALTVAAATLSSARRLPAAWVAAGLVGLTTLELALNAASLPLGFPSTSAVLDVPPYVRFLRTVAPGDGAARSVFAFPGGVRALDLLPAAWGVPMLNGYDSMPLARYTALAGGMHYWGVIPEAALSGPARFLDLLDTRYLVLDFRRNGPLTVSIDGVVLARDELGLLLRPGDAVELVLPSPVTASAVAAVTALGESLQIAQDTAVLRIDVLDAEGGEETVWWRAGVHTAEWAWDRADVRPVVPHARARVVEQLPRGGHRYFGFARTARPLQASRVRAAYVAPSGALELSRLSLYDDASGQSQPLSRLHHLLAEDARWQPRFRGDSVVVLENQRALPRAWLVPTTRRLAAADALHAVESGMLSDGEPFDATSMALVEDGPDLSAPAVDGDARVEVVGYSPTRIALEAHAPGPSFLVLSEIYCPGWQATVDGVPAPIWRTDYALRGVALPAGARRIELVYAPRAPRLGAAISLLALLALAAGGVARLRRGPRPRGE